MFHTTGQYHYRLAQLQASEAGYYTANLSLGSVDDMDHALRSQTAVTPGPPPTFICPKDEASIKTTDLFLLLTLIKSDCKRTSL